MGFSNKKIIFGVLFQIKIAKNGEVTLKRSVDNQSIIFRFRFTLNLKIQIVYAPNEFKRSEKIVRWNILKTTDISGSIFRRAILRPSLWV
jgi:hypothetical protein